MFPSSSSPCPCCGASSARQTYPAYPSPSAGMLSSNTVFSADQTRRHSETIAEIEVQISRLDDEKSRLQKAMDYLLNERQEFQRSLDEHRCLVAPIRRIPPELLSEIFLHCLDGDSDLDITAAPLVLTFVCSRWRTVAICTLQLWSSVSLGYSGPIVTEMLQTWLSRSRLAALTFTIDSDCFEDTQTTHSCIGALIPHSDHWRDVAFMLVPELYETEADMLPPI